MSDTLDNALLKVAGATNAPDNLDAALLRVAGVKADGVHPAIAGIAQRLGIDPDHLNRVIHYESGGRPDAVNPTSGATGLIQFMPFTAQGMGTSVEALRHMSIEQQAPYIEQYLRQNGATGKNFSDLYASVLYPSAVGKPLDSPLFARGTKAYSQNSQLDANHDGTVTKREAAQAAWGHGTMPDGAGPLTRANSAPKDSSANIRNGVEDLSIPPKSAALQRRPGAPKSRLAMNGGAPNIPNAPTDPASDPNSPQYATGLWHTGYKFDGDGPRLLAHFQKNTNPHPAPTGWKDTSQEGPLAEWFRSLPIGPGTSQHFQDKVNDTTENLAKSLKDTRVGGVSPIETLLRMTPGLAPFMDIPKVNEVAQSATAGMGAQVVLSPLHLASSVGTMADTDRPLGDRLKATGETAIAALPVEALAKELVLGGLEAAKAVHYATAAIALKKSGDTKGLARLGAEMAIHGFNPETNTVGSALKKGLAAGIDKGFTPRFVGHEAPAVEAPKPVTTKIVEVAKEKGADPVNVVQQVQNAREKQNVRVNREGNPALAGIHPKVKGLSPDPVLTGDIGNTRVTTSEPIKTGEIPTPEAIAPNPLAKAEPTGQPDVTGVAKQITGRAPQPGTTIESIAAEGKAAFESGKVNPVAVADHVHKTGTPMSDVELSAVGARLRQIRNRQAAILSEQRSDPASALASQGEHDALDQEAEHLLGAADITLNKGFHRLGMAAQVAYAPDYSISPLRARARLANLGEALPPHVQAQIDAIGKKYEDAQLALENAKKQFALDASQKPPKAALPGPVADRVRQKNVDSIRRYLGAEKGATPARDGLGGGRQAGAASYSIPDAERNAMQAARSLAREQVQGGAKTLDEVMGGIRKATGLSIPDDTLLKMISDPYRKSMIESDIARMQANRTMRDIQNAAQTRMRPSYQKALGVVGQIFTTTQRSMQAGFDLSAPFIQGRKGLFANPQGWAKAWHPMIEAAIKGDEAALGHFAAIQEHPMYARSKAAGLDLTEPGGRFTAQEEMFAGNLVNLMAHSKVPVLKQYAQALERSEFAYTSFLNKLRYDTFTKMAQAAPNDPAYLRDVANTINVIYGRGGGELAKRIGAVPGVGNVAYAPRYALSQFQYAAGQPIMKAETAAGRVNAMKVYAAQGAAYGGLVMLARLAGWKVGTDPRSTNFGKLQAPDGQLIDMFAKEGQAYRLGAQLLYGKISVNGNYKAPGDYGAKETVGAQFVEGKLAPVARNVMEKVYGKYNPKSGDTKPLTVKDAITGFAPIWIQQALQDGTLKTAPFNIVGLDNSLGKMKDVKVPLNLMKPGAKSSE